MLSNAHGFTSTSAIVCDSFCLPPRALLQPECGCVLSSLSRTQVGFLNVHTEPGDPFRTDNVVRQLPHGAVVESKVEQGVWVDHDGGGWSIRVYDGHEYLVPVD